MSLSQFLAAAEDGGSGFQAPTVEHSFFFDRIGDGAVISSVKAMVLLLLGTAIIIAFLTTSARKSAVVPSKFQFIGEGLYGFVRNGVAIEILGRQGKKWAGFLATLFVFILVMNVYEIIPVAQLPVTSHFAVPAFLALLVWVIYNVVGIKKHGLLGYLKLMCYIAGVPWYMHILLIPIEFLSNIILRPFTLAVRLFANMFAGHMLVAVAAAGTIFLFEQGGISYGTMILPFAASLFLAFFELLICALQAYVFVLLAAIYLESSLADSH